MRILIAPNAFKNSLDATQAATAIREGLMQSALRPECVLHPIADGGDGTLDVLLNQLHGEKRFATVEDPLGRPVEAAYGLIHQHKTAVVEMAEASGLRLLHNNELNPMKASTYGTGQLLRKALDQGVEKIIVGVGGSATVDGGAGMAMALGAKLLDDAGKEISRGGKGITQLHSIDLSQVDRRLKNVKIIVTCDVTTNLMEAPQVFGPQKGATPEMIRELEEGFDRYSEIVHKTTNKEIKNLASGGAAGGISAALYALFQAELVEGTEYLLSQTGFQNTLLQSDILITAEGALDTQTQTGKGPFYVAQQARAQGKYVIMLAGSLPQTFDPQDYAVYHAVFAIGAKPEPLERAMQHTRQNLIRTAQQIGNLLAIKK